MQLLQKICILVLTIKLATGFLVTRCQYPTFSVRCVFHPAQHNRYTHILSFLQRDCTTFITDDAQASKQRPKILPECSIISPSQTIELSGEIEMTLDSLKNAIALAGAKFHVQNLQKLYKNKATSSYLWVFATLHQNPNYVKSIIHLCKSIKELYKGTSCTFIDITKHPYFIVEHPRKIPSVEINIVSLDKEILMSDDFPNLEKFLHLVNPETVTEKSHVVQSDPGLNLLECNAATGEVSLLTDALFHEIDVAIEKRKSRAYLNDTGIKEAPYSILQYLSSSVITVPKIEKFFIVYIILEDCSSCDNALPHLKILKGRCRDNGNTLHYIDCQKERDVCSLQNITGFPTLVGYKVLPEALSCGISLQDTFSIPYHGAFISSHLLEWYTDVNDMGIHYTAPHDFQDGCNIHLVVSTDTDSSDKLKLECIEMLCKHLSYVECFIPAPGEFVTSINFEHRDGISSLIYVDTKPLSLTFSHSPELHYQHKVHDYEEFICRENVLRCVEMIQVFIREHSRLLITELSPMLFHTSTSYKPLFGDLPVLVAIVDHEVISSDFMSQLEMVAQEYYSDIATAFVHADRYPTWTSGMLPKQDTVPGAESWMYKLPRVLIFHLNDHNNAAFLQIVGKHLDNRQIEQFVTKYLKGDVRLEPCYGI